MKIGFLLIVLFWLMTAGLYGQEKEVLDTVSVVGKVVEIKQNNDESGKGLWILVIENIKNEKVSFLTDAETKVWIEDLEDKLEWIKIGTSATIDYKIDLKGNKVAIWIYALERKAEDQFDTGEISPIEEEDTRNEEFFQGIDSTKLGKDVDLGVKENEDE